MSESYYDSVLCFCYFGTGLGQKWARSFSLYFLVANFNIKEAIVGPVKMFNIIDHESGYKADFVVLKDDPYRQEEFSRRVKVNYIGKDIYVVSPEDLLISKLI